MALGVAGPYLSTQYAYTGSQSLVVSGTSSGGHRRRVRGNARQFVHGIGLRDDPGNADRQRDGLLEIVFLQLVGQPDRFASTAPNSITILTASSAAGGPLAGSVGNPGWNHFYTTAVAPAGAAYMEAQVETYGWAGEQRGLLRRRRTRADPRRALRVLPSSNAASISNSGTLTVGPANTVTVSGTFTQTSTGTLDLQLGGAPSTGELRLRQRHRAAATLAGTLKADVVNGYSPATTDTFTPIEFASETGSFATERCPAARVTSSPPPSASRTSRSAPPRPRCSPPPSMRRRACTPSRPTCWASTWPTGTRTPGRPRPQQMLTAAGLDIYRFPGGSAADDFHFNIADN